MQNLTDTELLDAYVAGENMPQADTCGKTPREAAFGELMRRHGALVYRACHRLLKDAHEAEDASQAVFVVLAQKAGKLRKGDLSAWLYRVAHHVAAETVRRRMRRTGREAAYAATEAIQVGEFASPDAAESDVLGLLDTALLSLPERYRQAVILRYLQNHSEKDAAQLASVPLGTLSGRASQGIAMLRQRLAKRGVALGGVALVSLLTSEASAAVPETLLPSILATVKSVAAGAATTTTATTTAAMLAKGAMKAMFIAKVKMVAVVAAVVIVTGSAVPVGIAVAQAGKADIEKKTQETVIDTLSFKFVPIEKVLDTISEKGGIVIKKVDIPKDTPPVTFAAKYISALEAIKIVTEVANLTYTITDVGIVVSGKEDKAGKKQDGTDDPFKPAVNVAAMAQRTYTISPLAATALAEKTGGGTDDEKIKQMFVKLGVAFPPGSTVTYTPASRKLVVRSPAENWEAIENCISQLFATSAPIPPKTKP